MIRTDAVTRLFLCGWLLLCSCTDTDTADSTPSDPTSSDSTPSNSGAIVPPQPADPSTEEAFLPPSAAVLGTYRLVIEPGDGAEVDFKMETGARVEARYRADGKLLIEAHVHYDGDKVRSFGRRVAQDATGRMEAVRDGIYSFLWAHAEVDGPIELIVTLVGDASINRWVTGQYDGSARLEAERALEGVERVK